MCPKFPSNPQENAFLFFCTSLVPPNSQEMWTQAQGLFQGLVWGQDKKSLETETGGFCLGWAQNMGFWGFFWPFPETLHDPLSLWVLQMGLSQILEIYYLQSLLSPKFVISKIYYLQSFREFIISSVWIFVLKFAVLIFFSLFPFLDFLQWSFSFILLEGTRKCSVGWSEFLPSWELGPIRQSQQSCLHFMVIILHSSSVHNHSSSFQARILILISCFWCVSWGINDPVPWTPKWPFWKRKMVLLVQNSVSEEQHSALCHINTQIDLHTWANQRNFWAFGAPQELSRRVKCSRGEQDGTARTSLPGSALAWHNVTSALLSSAPQCSCSSFHTKILPHSWKTVNH